VRSPRAVCSSWQPSGDGGEGVRPGVRRSADTDGIGSSFAGVEHHRSHLNSHETAKQNLPRTPLLMAASPPSAAIQVGPQANAALRAGRAGAMRRARPARLPVYYLNGQPDEIQEK
jgi:hypothetical protein